MASDPSAQQNVPFFVVTMPLHGDTAGAAANSSSANAAMQRGRALVSEHRSPAKASSGSQDEEPTISADAISHQQQQSSNAPTVLPSATLRALAARTEMYDRVLMDALAQIARPPPPPPTSGSPALLVGRPSPQPHTANGSAVVRAQSTTSDPQMAEEEAKRRQRVSDVLSTLCAVHVAAMHRAAQRRLAAATAHHHQNSSGRGSNIQPQQQPEQSDDPAGLIAAFRVSSSGLRVPPSGGGGGGAFAASHAASSANMSVGGRIPRHHHHHHTSHAANHRSSAPTLWSVFTLSERVALFVPDEPIAAIPPTAATTTDALVVAAPAPAKQKAPLPVHELFTSAPVVTPSASQATHAARCAVARAGAAWAHRVLDACARAAQNNTSRFGTAGAGGEDADGNRFEVVHNDAAGDARLLMTAAVRTIVGASSASMGRVAAVAAANAGAVDVPVFCLFTPQSATDLACGGVPCGATSMNQSTAGVVSPASSQGGVERAGVVQHTSHAAHTSLYEAAEAAVSQVRAHYGPLACPLSSTAAGQTSSSGQHTSSGGPSAEQSQMPLGRPPLPTGGGPSFAFAPPAHPPPAAAPMPPAAGMRSVVSLGAFSTASAGVAATPLQVGHNVGHGLFPDTASSAMPVSVASSYAVVDSTPQTPQPWTPGAHATTTLRPNGDGRLSRGGSEGTITPTSHLISPNTDHTNNTYSGQSHGSSGRTKQQQHHVTIQAELPGGGGGGAMTRHASNESFAAFAAATSRLHSGMPLRVVTSNDDTHHADLAAHQHPSGSRANYAPTIASTAASTAARFRLRQRLHQVVAQNNFSVLAHSFDHYDGAAPGASAAASGAPMDVHTLRLAEDVAESEAAERMTLGTATIGGLGVESRAGRSAPNFAGMAEEFSASGGDVIDGLNAEVQRHFFAVNGGGSISLDGGHPAVVANAISGTAQQVQVTAGSQPPPILVASRVAPPQHDQASLPRTAGTPPSFTAPASAPLAVPVTHLRRSGSGGSLPPSSFSPPVGLGAAVGQQQQHQLSSGSVSSNSRLGSTANTNAPVGLPILVSGGGGYGALSAGGGSAPIPVRLPGSGGSAASTSHAGGSHPGLGTQGLGGMSSHSSLVKAFGYGHSGDASSTGTGGPGGARSGTRGNSADPSVRVCLDGCCAVDAFLSIDPALVLSAIAAARRDDTAIDRSGDAAANKNPPGVFAAWVNSVRATFRTYRMILMPPKPIKKKGAARAASTNGNSQQWAVSTKPRETSDTDAEDEEVLAYSPNIGRVFLFNLLDGAAFGLWQSTGMQQFLYDLAGQSNAIVGYMSGANGFSQMAAATIASITHDKHTARAETLLRLASFFGIVSVLGTVAAIYYRSMWAFWVTNVTWGLYVGLNSPTSEAVFANSIENGRRVEIYTARWVVQILSYLGGYVASLVLFDRLGNTWSLGVLADVMYGGLALHPLAMIVLWIIRERDTLRGMKHAERRRAARIERQRDERAARQQRRQRSTPRMTAVCTQCGLEATADDPTQSGSGGGANGEWAGSDVEVSTATTSTIGSSSHRSTRIRTLQRLMSGLSGHGQHDAPQQPGSQGQPHTYGTFHHHNPSTLSDRTTHSPIAEDAIAAPPVPCGQVTQPFNSSNRSAFHERSVSWTSRGGGGSGGMGAAGTPTGVAAVTNGDGRPSSLTTGAAQTAHGPAAGSLPPLRVSGGGGGFPCPGCGGPVVLRHILAPASRLPQAVEADAGPTAIVPAAAVRIGATGGAGNRNMRNQPSPRAQSVLSIGGVTVSSATTCRYDAEEETSTLSTGNTADGVDGVGVGGEVGAYASDGAAYNPEVDDDATTDSSTGATSTVATDDSVARAEEAELLRQLEIEEEEKRKETGDPLLPDWIFRVLRLLFFCSLWFGAASSPSANRGASPPRDGRSNNASPSIQHGPARRHNNTTKPPYGSGSGSPSDEEEDDAGHDAYYRSRDDSIAVNIRGGGNDDDPNGRVSSGDDLGRPLLDGSEKLVPEHPHKEVGEQQQAGRRGNMFTSDPLGNTGGVTLVPILVVTGDLIQAIGGGMTVRFLPLFFVNDYNVSPVGMAIVSILMSLSAALVAKVLQSLILRLCRGNRIFVVAIARTLGSAGLVYLAYAEGAAAARMPMLCVYIFRSALLNSILGMTRSVVMDFARSSHRAKYSAMESVSNLGWSGSAVVGGILVDKFGYRSTFVWTAGFHFAAALVVLPAARYVARLKPTAVKKAE